MVDQDAPHGLGGHTEEVRPARERDLGLIHQLDVRLVDQRRRVERLVGRAVAQETARQHAELLVDERRQLVQGPRLTLADAAQQLRDAVHRGRRHAALQSLSSPGMA